MKLLTKSKYLVGLQCSKYLWMMFHEKHKIPEPDEQAQFKFDQGYLVGNLAKSLFKEGIDISTEDFKKNLKDSKELLKLKKPLFEPAFLFERLYSRADILEPNKEGWDIIEVKSSTSVKDVHITDVAFQKYCYEKVGLNIKKCFLMHINNEYVRKGKIEAKKLFVKEDITKDVEKEILLIPERLKNMFKIIDADKNPVTKIGKNCGKPYECPLIDDCWSFLPENSVFDLYNPRGREIELFESGILAIKDIPEQYELHEKQKIQHKCEKTGKPYIDKKGIKEFLDVLKYPLYFMDFETYSTVIPLYDGLKPYQNIPFQFSVHVIKKGEKPKHYSFIAEGNEDPRKKFIENLKNVIGERGSVVVYNKSFEAGRLKELALEFPEYKKFADLTIKRMADLYAVFRNFYYYHPKQKGSASIKYVLPALTGKSYEGMDISNGGDASLNYLYITHGKAGKEEVLKVRKDLEKYCSLDTEGMVWILEKLREITEK